MGPSERNLTTLQQADALLADTGLRDAMGEFGEVIIHGSYKLGTMAWRELDIFVAFETLKIDGVYGVFQKIVQCVKPAEIFVLDQIQHPRRFGPGNSFKMELTTMPYNDKEDTCWKLDLCCITKEYWYGRAHHHSDTVLAALNDETRAAIIKIKHAIYRDDRYRSQHWRPQPLQNSFAGSDIFDAVVKHGISDAVAFIEWHENRCRAPKV